MQQKETSEDDPASDDSTDSSTASLEKDGKQTTRHARNESLNSKNEINLVEDEADEQKRAKRGARKGLLSAGSKRKPANKFVPKIRIKSKKKGSFIRVVESDGKINLEGNEGVSDKDVMQNLAQPSLEARRPLPNQDTTTEHAHASLPVAGGIGVPAVTTPDMSAMTGMIATIDA